MHRDLAKRLVSEGILFRGAELSQEGVEKLFHDLMVINPSIEAYLLEPDGTIRAYSAPAGDVKLDQIDLDPIQRFLRSESPWSIMGENPRHPEEEAIFSVSPVPIQGPPKAFLYLVLGGEEYRSAVDMLQGNLGLQLSIMAGVGALILSLIAGLLAFRLLTRRLFFLKAEFEGFNEEGLSESIPRNFESIPPLSDEIDSLYASFQAMEKRIHQYVRNLRENEQFRQGLLAALSHDLRTPLLSLCAHIETLRRKEGRLPPPERDRLLEVATRACKKLNFSFVSARRCRTFGVFRSFLLTEGRAGHLRR